MFDKYPYTDFHEMNLDWIIKEMKQLIEDWEEFSGRVSAEAHEATTPEVSVTGDLKEGLNFDFGLVRGPRGITGATGPQGEQGPAGEGLQILDTYPTLSELQTAHPTGSSGDAYLVGSGSSFTLYIWSTSSSVWTNVGSIATPSPSNISPSMNGAAAAGSSQLYSRGDHVHPSDSTKLDKSTTDGVYAVENGSQTMIETSDNSKPDAIVRYDSIGDVNTYNLNASGNITADGDVNCDEISVTNNAILNSQMLVAEVSTNAYRPMATINPIDPLVLNYDLSTNVPSIKFNAVAYDQSGNRNTLSPEIKFTDDFTVNTTDYSETRIALAKDIYKTGDTYTFSEYIVSGYVTGSSKQIALSFYLPKEFNGISNVTFTEFYMRTISGRIDVDLTNITSITISPKNNHYIRLIIYLNTALNVATNTPMGAQVSGVITFS